MTERRKVQIYNNVAPFPKKVYNGSNTSYLTIQNGSRLVFSFHVFAIDPATTVTVKVSTAFSEEMPFCEIFNLTSDTIQTLKAIATDFHGFINVELEVIGGNAEVIVGMTVFDNALSTRIENAEIAVDLNHVLQSNGAYDSVRLGDGVTEAKVDPKNKSLSVNRYEKILPLLSNAKWLGLVDYENIQTTFTPDVAQLDYQKGGNTVATAIFTFVSDTDWSFTLQSFINNDDGSVLLDDDDSQLLLD